MERKHESSQEQEPVVLAPYREPALNNYERSAKKLYDEWDSRFSDMSVKEIQELVAKDGDKMSFGTVSKEGIEITINSGPNKTMVARHNQEFPEYIRDKVGEAVERKNAIKERRNTWENKIAGEIHDLEELGKTKSGFAKMLSFIQGRKREEALRDLQRESWEHRSFDRDIDKQLRDIVKAGLLDDASDEIEAGLKEVKKKVKEYSAKRDELDERYAKATES